MSTPSEPKLPFERLGDYEVLAPISEGGMASVWLGRSTVRPAELAAIKVIRAEHGRNKDFVAMLVDEAGLATRLAHPNVLVTRSFGHDGKRHFLVMELLRGRPLLEVSKAAHAQGKRLPVEVVAWVGARIADAVHYVHELKDAEGAPLGVVHRDVNPANIFVTREGDPKLIDFGLAKARDRIASTAIGVVKGKLAYLAPEQALGKTADRRADVFALGVTLWELSLDRRLFLDESDVETVRRVRAAEVPDPASIDPDYPRALADALKRALARDPGARWQTAAELRDALDGFVALSGKPVGAASVRAAMHDLFAKEPPAGWERLADESASEQERTRIYQESAEGGGDVPQAVAPPLGRLPTPLPPPRRPAALRAGPGLLSGLSIETPWVLAAACALGASLLSAILVRGCSGSARTLEPRVARIEDLLGLSDAAPPVSAVASDNAATASEGGAPVLPLDDRLGPCAGAKVTGYQAWQEALAKAKAIAGSAEAACADFRSDRKKQACFYAAMAESRTAQAARDAVIAGGDAFHDAVKAVKDDPKNPALARALTASEAAFAACEVDAGS